MNVTELASGLWRWTAPHPEWTEGDDWEQEVGCVYYEAPDATVLIDPLVPPEREQFFLALDRDVERRGLPVSILLTASWHARSQAELVERYATTAETPAAVEELALPPEMEETLWWLPEHRTLVAGDVLVGAAGEVSVCPDSWLDQRCTPAALRTALRPLLDLPLERILVAHGEPVLQDGREALERALES